MPSLYKSETKSWPARDKDDHYPTEPACVNYCTGILMAHLYLANALPKYMNIADIGAGSGIWGAAWIDAYDKWFPDFRHQVVGYEIRPIAAPTYYDGWLQEDIFKMNWYLEQSSLNLWAAFGNPPYIPNWRLMMNTISQMVTAFPYVGFLLKDSYLAGQDRLQQIYFRNPPLAVWKAASRVSFSGDKNSNADEYVFIVWQRGYEGDTHYYWFNHRNSFVDTRFQNKVLAKISAEGTAAEAAAFLTLFDTGWGAEFISGQKENRHNLLRQSANG